MPLKQNAKLCLQHLKILPTFKDSVKQQKVFQNMWREHRRNVLRAEDKQPQKAHSGQTSK